MRGAIAAGHPLTTRAGARVLEEGGNAIDACIAAAFAAAVAEGPLTGPAGGGFLIVDAPGGEAIVLDCFFAAPSRPIGELEEVLVDFEGAGTQIFHVGEGSVAVPGLVAGLEEAHRRYATRPWRVLLEPAIELARAGVPVIPETAFLHRILAAILLRSEAGRRIYGHAERLDTAELAGSLERVRDEGAGALRELLPELVDDLDAYEVVVRMPIRARFRGTEVLTTPNPSRGGEIVAAALAALDAAQEARASERIEVDGAMVSALRAAYEANDGVARLTGTTHIAVVDGDGLAASFSSSLASGAGVFRGGFQLNNMLGEVDIVGGHEPQPGERLPSMMAPTIVRSDDGVRLVLGSAGSVRVAAAIVQVVQGIIGNALSVGEAIARPRLFVDGHHLHVEGGADGAGASLHGDDLGLDVVRWEGLNLFFGGVQAVERHADGNLSAAGDPRRGGTGLVV